MFKSKVWDDVYEKKVSSFQLARGLEGWIGNYVSKSTTSAYANENATKKWSAYASQCGKLYKQSTFLGN